MRGGEDSLRARPRPLHEGKNDKIDSHKIALLLKGGMLPLAYAYPGPMRATRDLLRRRTKLVRVRAEALAHVQNTVSQYNLPPLSKKLQFASNREGVAELFADESVQRMVQADLDLIGHVDEQVGNKQQNSRTAGMRCKPVASSAS